MLWSLSLVIGCDSGSELVKGPSAADTGSTVDLPADSGEDTAEHGTDCESFGRSDVAAHLSLETDAWVHDEARTDGNPLKGFLTSYLWAEPANDMPDSMEFLYLPMSALWGADGETFDAGLEPLLEAAAARAHHAVLRVYLDYPTKPSGVPDYLAETVGCSPYADHGGGCSPDYEHPELKAAILGLIDSLGERYDGDPRLGFVQVGLLGFWGEWHTWPHTELFPSEAMQAEVLDAFVGAFSITHLMVRRPAVHAVDLRIGFHDDSFAYSTLGDIDWFFWPGLIAAGAAERWQQVPIGGELRPELQSQVFDDAYSVGTYSQDFNACAETTHASFLLNYWAYSGDGVGYVGEERVRAERAARDMGYAFALTGASLHLSALDEGHVDGTVRLEIAATGVAPFYYSLEPTLVDQGTGEVLASADPLLSLLPGDSHTAEFIIRNAPSRVFEGPLMLELRSPMLLHGQRIQLPTITPWTLSEGLTSVAWTLGCEGPDGRLSVGDLSTVDDRVCECRCDVDGTLRGPSGELCF